MVPALACFVLPVFPFVSVLHACHKGQQFTTNHIQPVFHCCIMSAISFSKVSYVTQAMSAFGFRWRNPPASRLELMMHLCNSDLKEIILAVALQ